VITQYEIALETGLRVNKVTVLADDLALKMSARSIRVARIPGRDMVGVEVPNPKSRVVVLRELLDLFERVINLVRRHAPSAAIAFNSTPLDTFVAAARWLDTTA